MKTISIIIPAYNEEKRLPATLEKWQILLAKKNPNYKVAEIIIVDDGSKDKTISVAQYFKKSLPIKIIEVKPNKGKGNAVRAGVKKAVGDLIFIYDADAAVLPEEIEKLLSKIDNADIVIGSRTAKDSKTKMSFKRKLVGKCFHIICYPLLPKIKDASCGAKLSKTDVAKKIFELQKIDRFAFDIEILWLAKKLNFKIQEVGIIWQEIPNSKVNIIKDSFEMFFSVLGLYKRALLS
jgi:glycosyltransferase involved in cell wall biosynthesis